MVFYDVCEECRVVGADYHYDDNGELVSSCYKCPYEDTGDTTLQYPKFG